jgi:hypothetical protein
MECVPQWALCCLKCRTNNGRKDMLLKVLSDYTRKSMQVFTKTLPYLDNKFQQVAKIYQYSFLKSTFLSLGTDQGSQIWL